MNELQVQAHLTPGTINFNFDEIKEQVQSIADAYEGAEFHEDTAKEAKASVATLRKIRKAINDRKIDVKKQYNTPYATFENQVKELFAIIDAPIDSINKQVVVFDEKKKAEKRARIQEVYDSFTDEIKSIFALESVFNSKWENKTYLMEDIIKELEAVAEKVEKDLIVIKNMKSDVEAKAIEKYKNGLDLASAVQFINDDKDRKAEILRKQKEADTKAKEEQIRNEERAKITQEQKTQEVKAEAAQETQQAVIENLTPESAPEEEMQEYTYKVKLSFEGKKTFEMYMNSVGIDYDEQVKAWI